MGPQSSNSDMWPVCLTGKTVVGKFDSVSTHARSIGLDVDSTYEIQFSPVNSTYAMTFEVGGIIRGVLGHYTWSPAILWRDSLSAGSNTRQAELTLGGIRGEIVDGMCIASEQNSGSFTSQLGVASFNVVSASSVPGLGSLI